MSVHQLNTHTLYCSVNNTLTYTRYTISCNKKDVDKLSPVICGGHTLTHVHHARQTLSRSLRLSRGGWGGGVNGFSHRTPIGLPNTSTKLSVLYEEVAKDRILILSSVIRISVTDKFLAQWTGILIGLVLNNIVDTRHNSWTQRIDQFSIPVFASSVSHISNHEEEDIREIFCCILMQNHAGSCANIVNKA